MTTTTTARQILNAMLAEVARAWAPPSAAAAPRELRQIADQLEAHAAALRDLSNALDEAPPA